VSRLLRRHRTAVLAAALLGLAALLALLAVDIHSWRSTVARDDMRFRALPAHARLWEPSTILPGDPASLLIGTHSTLAYRRALQYFWYTRSGSSPLSRTDAPTMRAQAQERMQTMIAQAPTPAQRSNAANLLGVLVVTTPLVGNDTSAIVQTLNRAAEYFQQAITIDPANFDAKQNLELVLRLKRPGKSRLGKDARAGYGFGRGRGAGLEGSGY
jgi:hypothetical protein